MKNRTYISVLLSAVFIVVTLIETTSCNNMQKSGGTIGNGDSTKTDTVHHGNDAPFLIKAAEINLEEIRLGQLAQQKGTQTDIKELGKMMEDDHTKAFNDLTALALKKSIPLRTSLDSNAKNDYEKLNNAAGSDFDKQYCDMMVSGHKDAIALFEKESTDATDADVRQMAIATLPTLHKHLDHATMCQQKLGKMQ